MEFGLFHKNSPRSVSNDGWELIETLDELLDIKTEFISSYNNNGGLSRISLFGTSNCCIGFGQNDTYLTISNPNNGESSKYYHYVYLSFNGEIICNSWPGFVEEKYKLYRMVGERNLEILNDNDIFGSTRACFSDKTSIAAIYKRYC